jgi:tRNA(Ile)-lysidine synthase
MKPRSDKFVKPMLSITKNDIYEYMRSNHFEWREDSSNQETKYKRNKVRIELVPILESLSGGNSALYSRLESISEQSYEVKELLQRQVNFVEPLQKLLQFLKTSISLIFIRIG